MPDLILIAIASAVAALVLIIFLLFKIRSSAMAQMKLIDELGKTKNDLDEAKDSLERINIRFSSIINVDSEKERIEAQIIDRRVQLEGLDQIYTRLSAVAQEKHDKFVRDNSTLLERLRSDYQAKRAIYDQLIKEVAIFDERISFAEMGVYAPHFEFDDSEQYKSAIIQARDEQKYMVSDKTAVYCTTSWTVDGSQSKGQTMTNRGIRLTLRAFNNECDAAISNTRWNNVNAMEKRIIRAYDQIDKLNASSSILISKDYLQLKLKELYLTHEYREKIKKEREERAELARLAKDEARLQRDMENAQEQEDHYARMLAKAKSEAEKITGPKLSAFEEQIKILEKHLAEAHARAERAQSMAELTRSGYVYIISNIGSFGEGVVKIGLTRRLDPMDRVRELGDASVPFVFDTHAIIYSDDAPSLERALHSEFELMRINVQNYRKEFFRTPIDDVEKAVQRLAPGAPFFRDVEAQEYRETLSRRRQALTLSEPDRTIFPAEL